MIEFISQNPIFQNPIILTIFLVIGLAILKKKKKIFVDGASNIAYNFKIPAVIVGLTIVAFGTSAPEAATSIAFLSEKAAEAMGTIVGSNIFNILGVIGISTLFGTLAVEKDLIKRDFPFLVISTIGLLIIAYYFFLIPRILRKNNEIKEEKNMLKIIPKNELEQILMKEDIRI